MSAGGMAYQVSGMRERPAPLPGSRLASPSASSLARALVAVVVATRALSAISRVVAPRPGVSVQLRLSSRAVHTLPAAPSTGGVGITGIPVPVAVGVGVGMGVVFLLGMSELLR
jgi:hypothetical protein